MEDSGASPTEDGVGGDYGCLTTDPYFSCEADEDEPKPAVLEVAEEEEDDGGLFFVDTAGQKDALPPSPEPVAKAKARTRQERRPQPPARPPPEEPPGCEDEAPVLRVTREAMLAFRTWTVPAPPPPGYPKLRPRGEHPTVVSRMPLPVYVSRPPTTFDGFGATLALAAAQSARAADSGFEALCAECLDALKTMCGEALSGEEFKVAPFDWTPDVRLESFGSSRQGTALRSSDLDVRLSFEQFQVREEHRQLRYLEGIAARTGPHFSVVRLVRARLPVLRLRYREQLDVDMTMGEDLAGGADVDAAVRGLLEAAPDSGARQFVRLVKIFAKAHGLVDAPSGFLNSVSWVFLTLVFLQTESCLPSYTRLLQGGRRRALWTARPALSLLVRFFAFMNYCAKTPQHLSVTLGQVWPSKPVTAGGHAPPCLFVEHPLKPGVNLAHCLSPAGWARITSLCEEAHLRLSRGLVSPDEGDSGALESASDAAIAFVLRTGEVEDPTEEPSAKRLRLDRQGGHCPGGGAEA